MNKLYQYLPEHLRLPPGTFIHGFAGAIDSTHLKILNLIEACIDQLFLTTAVGRYLVRLGEQEGFVMPPNSGLDIRAYRILVPLIVAAPKQIRRTVDQIVEAFYGIDRMRPALVATTPSPYSLTSGDNIIIESESGKLDLSILDTQVSNITKVEASELAAIINSVQSKIYADVTTDRNTLNKYLRLTSTSIGVSSVIRIVGGTLQNVLKFPNIIQTDIRAGTTWLVSKTQPYSDIVKIQWDGLGANPKMYLVKQGDILTIRGLPENPNRQELLNGSYEIIDAGYDYVIVRNAVWNQTFASVTCLLGDNFVFTDQSKITIYNNSEYGATSETDVNTATITVPAIPPLARRFLSGSAHLQGNEFEVIDFSRDFITIKIPPGVNKPIGVNCFVIKNNRLQYDFVNNFYRTVSVDTASNPTYRMDTISRDVSVLPPTTPMGIGVDNPLHAEVGSNEITMFFPNKHGLLRGWEFTLNNMTGEANFSASLLNARHVVSRVKSSQYLVFSLYDANGYPIKFNGVPFGPFNVRRYSVLTSEGADCYLQFDSPSEVYASGLKVGMTFRIDPDTGTNDDMFYGDGIRQRILHVTKIAGSLVDVVSGYGPGFPQNIITGAMGVRSCDFGGSAGVYWFDMFSAWNVENVMAGLRILPLGYTKSDNPHYVGAFVFDPQGKDTRFTVSKFIVHTTRPILKGNNDGVLFVDKVIGVVDQEDFPKSGKILIDYGNDNVEGPINYIAVIDGQGGDSQILVDRSYRFQRSHSVGAQVQFIHDTAPYCPTQNGKDVPFYLTGTAQSRNTLFSLIQEIIAGGIYMKRDVLLPQLRYLDSAIEPFE